MTTHVTPVTEEVESIPTPLAVTRSWRPWIGLGTVGLLAILVFWAFEALPFQDLPAHAGLIAMRHRFESSAFEQKYFILAPHIGPYSLFRFLGEVFLRVSSPLTAVRLLGTLPVVATPLAMLFARKRLHRESDPTFGYLGVALSFGIMTLMGFASYLLGVAFLLVGLTMWLDLMVKVDDKQATRGQEISMALFAPAIFVAHGHAFLLFCACAGLTTLVTGDRRARILRLRTLIPAVALAAYVAWIERGGPPAGSVSRYHDTLPRFQGPLDKLGLLLTPTLMTRSGIDSFVGCVLLFFTIACAIATLRAARGSNEPWARHARALYACATVIGLAFLILPHAVGWFGFVDGRLVPVALILALLGIRREVLTRPLARGLSFGAPVLAATIATLALVASYRFQPEARGYKEVLAHVPAEARLLNLPLDPNSDVFTAHPFVHYDKLVLAERPILVSDIWLHQGTALYPTPENPVLRLPASYSESNLKLIEWPAYHLEDWDYVLIRTRPDAAAPQTPAGLSLEDHRGGWWLYRLTRPS
jgi:hypothetical protein